jgi:hypothetical protein
LIFGMIGAVALAVIAGAVILLRPAPKPATPVAAAPTAAAPTVIPKPAPAPPQQTAAQAPPPATAPPVTPVPAPSPSAAAPAPAPQTAAAPPPPPPPPSAAPQLSPDDAAWQAAELANTVDAYRDFQKNFPGSFHVQGAQLRIVDILLLGPATAGKTFDGTWQTTYTCSPAGSALGFSFQFGTQVKDGVIHGVHGTPGERSSLVLDGKLQSGGEAAMIAKGVVGAAAFAAGGQPGGTPYAFHATAHFDRAAAIGRRIEGRECELTFAKQ